MNRREDVSTFRVLVAVAALGVVLVLAVLACLVRMGAPRHLLGLVSELCMTAGHVASELVSAMMVIVVLASVAIGAISLLMSWGRTRQFERQLVRTRRTCDRVHAAALDTGVDSRRIVVVRDERMLAFTCGLRTPKVYVSTGALDALDDDELRAVLLHEAHHMRRNDPLKLVSARIASHTFFWLPVLADLRRRYEIASEAAADARCIELLGTRRPLLRAVLQFVDTQSPMAVAHLTGGELADSRLRLMLNPESNLPPFATRRSAVVSVMAIVALHMLLALHLSLPAM